MSLRAPPFGFAKAKLRGVAISEFQKLKLTSTVISSAAKGNTTVISSAAEANTTVISSAAESNTTVISSAAEGGVEKSVKQFLPLYSFQHSVFLLDTLNQPYY